jgi:hypothetical protein
VDDDVAIAVVRPRPIAIVGAFLTRRIGFVLGDWTAPFDPAAVEVRDLRTGVVCLRRNFLSGTDACRPVCGQHERHAIAKATANVAPNEASGRF